MKIKICGITQQMEVGYLNEMAVDYAGFVFFEKSKRNISIAKAKELVGLLQPQIQRVAVTVSPDLQLVKQIEESGFHILQVHKELSIEVMENCHLPIWYAFNIADPRELEEKQNFINSLPNALQAKIAGLVVDGAEYGSGKTFDWTQSNGLHGDPELRKLFENRQFVLAGGLCAENVRTGMKLFAPDVVDVSSGVEGDNGKDFDKIKQFVTAVRDR